MKSSTGREADLQAILLELSFEMGDTLDRDIINAYLSRHPEFAKDIAEFADEWLYQDLLAGQPSPEDSTRDAIVAAALARISEEDVLSAGEIEGNSGLTDPFDHTTPQRLKQIARICSVDISIMAKLSNRLIDAGTIPLRLIEIMARELGTSAKTLSHFFSLPPRVSTNAEYKANTKPQTTKKESFADAVRSSGLEDQAQKAWLTEEER